MVTCHQENQKTLSQNKSTGRADERTARLPTFNMYINQQDAQISAIKLYFSSDALHVSEHVEHLMKSKV